MNIKTNQKGFTLIELLVVIVVIGILVALTLPNLFSAQERARDSERKNDLRNISQQLETYYNDNNSYPADLTALTTDDYMDEIPTDPSDDSAYTYEPTTDGTTACTEEPCATYTLTADLENDNDPDANDDGEFTVTSINRAGS